MYEVTVYPGTFAPWFTQVYAGLFDLRASGKARISINTQLPYPELMDSTALLMEAKEVDTGKKRTILIDLNDGPRFALPLSGSGSWFDLSEVKSDVIVKRSFSQKWIDQLPADVREKVIPYGINYNCGSRSMPVLKLLLAHQRMRLNLWGKRVSQKRRYWWQHQLRFMLYLGRNNLSLYQEDFEGTPQGPTKHRVFFITRLFEKWDNPGELMDFSRERVDLIKALRKELGDRFYGGIVNSDIAQRHCPKELIHPKISRRQFVNTVKESDIVISTLGVMDSNPWKLGEAIAAARCIVSEPLVYQLPSPLEEGKHLRTFVTIDDCLKTCEDLLNRPQLIAEMKENVWEYYKDNVKPERIMARVIAEAFKH